jgi:putative hydrolase of the HAD superfamily
VNQYAGVAAVLFDLDGTLIDHTRQIEDLSCETFDAFRDQLPPISPERFWETFWLKNHDLWYMVVDGALAGDAARLYSFVNTLRAVKADDRLAGPMLEDWEGRILTATRLFDDSLSTLCHLRSAGLRLGIVTNGFTTVQTRKIRRHALQDYVNFTLISEEARVFKPNPGIFRLGVERAGVAAQEALFVGDTPTSDIQGACEAGLRAVLMDPHDVWADEVGQVVPRLRCLRELLLLLGL